MSTGKLTKTVSPTVRILLLLGFVLIKFLLQYSFISPEYELHRDEFLHLDQAHHLAWGYLSVPPVSSWVASLIYLLGNSIFWIKFFPALFGALTVVVVWKTIEVLKGDLFALILGATCVLFSVLLRLNILFQPNSLDVLCWASVYYCLIRYINSQQAKWLFVGAIVFAFGFLNKYNIAFLLMGLIPALLINRKRKIFTEPSLYIAALIALVMILPNLWWQYSNGFPVVHHMKELSATQLVNVNRGDFIRAQLLFFLGSIPVLLAAFYALIFYPPFRPYRCFFWSFLFTFGVFLYFRAKDYYAIGLYPVYFSFGAIYCSQLFKSKWGKILKPVSIALPVVLFYPMLRIGFPNKSPKYIVQHPEHYQKFGLLRWEDGKDHPLPQDFADMQGWKELARKADSIYGILSSSGNTLVFCDNYGQTGAINYYTHNGINAVGYNADYINWFNLDSSYVNLIRVVNAWDRDKELRDVSPLFKNAKVEDSIVNMYARERGTVILSFASARMDINEIIRKEIDSLQHK
ncbi:MAG: glycosyltransferase family 39 protein [Candidatus Pseudobacter hemicellulosilyticus]|uniref:Glycosyltransferase family 39 protein n=1 Tax=Candidatus Pseudobacter hemicellulosilyticus TaxID=3121375 RepID=A0AAJ5WS60_9BACT|nr:MAG: glycosyltransferase family 39 protein [Pseudobacter sp.]